MYDYENGDPLIVWGYEWACLIPPKSIKGISVDDMQTLLVLEDQDAAEALARNQHPKYVVQLAGDETMNAFVLRTLELGADAYHLCAKTAALPVREALAEIFKVVKNGAIMEPETSSFLKAWLAAAAEMNAAKKPPALPPVSRKKSDRAP